MGKEEILEFGQQLRALRKSRGLTLEQLAYQCKLNEKFLGEVERGKSDLKIASALKIASGLKLSPAEFFSLVYPQQNLTPQGREILDLVVQVVRGENKRKIQKLKLFIKDIL